MILRQLQLIAAAIACSLPGAHVARGPRLQLRDVDLVNAPRAFAVHHRSRRIRARERRRARLAGQL